MKKSVSKTRRILSKTSGDFDIKIQDGCGREMVSKNTKLEELLHEDSYWMQWGRDGLERPLGGT